MIKISIIVPVYNMEKYLRECLDSIVNQTLKEIEIILVNDGSTDSSLSIIKEYEKIDNRIKVLDIKNSGPSNARNVGTAIATGEFIMNVDSDDWIDLDTCETVYNEAIANNADAVLFANTGESTSGTIFKSPYSEEKIVFDEEAVREDVFKYVLGLTGERLKHPEKLDALTSTCVRIYKNSIIKENNIKNLSWDLIPSECHLFNICYFCYSKRVVFIKKYFYHYRRNIASTSKKYRENYFDRWLYWIDYVKGFIDKNCPETGVYDAYYSRICFSVIPLSGNCFRLKDFQKTYGELKKILNNEHYIEAYKHFNGANLPVEWKVYFFLARHKMTLAFYGLSRLMRMLIENKKR